MCFFFFCFECGLSEHFAVLVRCVHIITSLVTAFQRCYVQNWEVHVQFKIHGSGKNLYGDGIAFWYTKERMQMGMHMA